MTWAEFISQMEAAGVTPDTIIDYIDISHTDELDVVLKPLDDGMHVEVL